MKPNQTLIKALNSAAVRIERRKGYEWDVMATCNCGILIQELLGMNEAELNHYYGTDEIIQSSWSEYASDGFCSTTGLPIEPIFRKLVEFGLERQDFAEIEYLGDRDNQAYQNPNVVSGWLQGKAVVLEQQLKEYPQGVETNSQLAAV